MPNITLSVDEETYRAARIYAAQQNATVSGVVRQFLRSLATAQTPTVRSRNLFAALDQAGTFSASDRLSRDEVHAR
ncbi:MAG: DUF6364 family protein [Rhodoferax sp.]|nr:DUF6364 family protein [Rhodoferax sp.]